MTREYYTTDDTEQGALEPDQYDVEVTEARVASERDDGAFTIFLDLKVLDGPDKGTVTSVSLYFPPEGTTKGLFFFKKKARALMPALVKAKADDAEETCDAVEGVKMTARLGIQKKGAYKGSQELLESWPLGQAPDGGEPSDDDDEDDDEPKAKSRTARNKARSAPRDEDPDDDDGDDADDEEDEEEPAKAKPRRRASAKDKPGF